MALAAGGLVLCAVAHEMGWKEVGLLLFSVTACEAAWINYRLRCPKCGARVCHLNFRLAKHWRSSFLGFPMFCDECEFPFGCEP